MAQRKVDLSDQFMASLLCFFADYTNKRIESHNERNNYWPVSEQLFGHRLLGCRTAWHDSPFLVLALKAVIGSFISATPRPSAYRSS